MMDTTQNNIHKVNYSQRYTVLPCG